MTSKRILKVLDEAIEDLSNKSDEEIYNEFFESSPTFRKERFKLLEQIIDTQDKELEGLEKENTELKKMNDRLLKEFNIHSDLFSDKIEECENLKAQIEKMKCCGNCRYFTQDFWWYKDREPCKRDCSCINYNKWELVE